MIRLVRWMGLLTFAHPAIRSQKEEFFNAMTSRLTRSMRMNMFMLSASFSTKLWRFLMVISIL